jgi:hypothetical protein
MTVFIILEYKAKSSSCQPISDLHLSVFIYTREADVAMIAA